MSLLNQTMGSHGTPRAATTGLSARPMSEFHQSRESIKRGEKTYLLTDNISDDQQDGETDKDDGGDRGPGELLQRKETEDTT